MRLWAGGRLLDNPLRLFEVMGKEDVGPIDPDLVNPSLTTLIPNATSTPWRRTHPKDSRNRATTVRDSDEVEGCVPPCLLEIQVVGGLGNIKFKKGERVHAPIQARGPRHFFSTWRATPAPWNAACPISKIQPRDHLPEWPRLQLHAQQEPQMRLRPPCLGASQNRKQKPQVGEW